MEVKRCRKAEKQMCTCAEVQEGAGEGAGAGEDAGYCRVDMVMQRCIFLEV